MKKNIMIIHGGGPTTVINASLYGILSEGKKSSEINKIYAAKNGTGGLLAENILDLTEVREEELAKLLTSPGSAIGTSRDPLKEEDYERMVAILQKYQIDYVLLNGGNGTMDTCGKLHHKCLELAVPISIIGVPKTMDNDIFITDHSPGYGSAARYMAQSVKEVCCDVKGMPIHVVIIETSGRNAGWVAAASALSDEEGIYTPDFIYLPEVVFDEGKFLQDVKDKLKEKKGIVIVASEGLRDEENQPLVKPNNTTGRSSYFGHVGVYLENLIVQNLGYKTRAEKPGLLARASIAMQSSVDREEAILAGKKAVEAVLAGETGKMVAFRRVVGETYQIETFLVAIEEVMLYEKKLPPHFINAEQNSVTPAFIEWCRPLIGEPLPEMISFN